ncbi:hypothetical protein ALQ16_201419 [Pseudomonas syringae pv. actinidiae]|nr:hypothetical protein ALQ16_201419 [Pseudomonas syringae pv. actinidiae]
MVMAIARHAHIFKMLDRRTPQAFLAQVQQQHVVFAGISVDQSPADALFELLSLGGIEAHRCGHQQHITHDQAVFEGLLGVFECADQQPTAQ